MWTRCRTGMLAAARVASDVVPSTALAVGATAEQIIAVAQQLGMARSTVDPSLAKCTTDPDSPDRWTATTHTAAT